MTRSIASSCWKLQPLSAYAVVIQQHHSLFSSDACDVESTMNNQQSNVGDNFSMSEATHSMVVQRLQAACPRYDAA